MVINEFLFLGIVFLLTFLLGRLIEKKMKVPWIFASLLVGVLLSLLNPFSQITSSETFSFLAQLGMYFLLFIIGYELDLRELKKNSSFILKSTFFIIFFEAFFGTLLIRYFFDTSWFISFIVSLSFATVGEAILVPILEEFNLVNKKIGQAIIGIGTFDDVIEILLLILVVFVIGGASAKTSLDHLNSFLILVLIFALFLLTYGLTRLRKKGETFSFIKIQMLFLLTLFIFFLFLGVGEYAHAAPISAFLSGIAIRTFIPKRRLKTIENDIKVLCYGFFAPIFFLWVGLSVNILSIIKYPLIILAVVLVSNASKILASYLVGRKELGVKQSILLGVGLSARFSTSIVIIKILYESKLISLELYSIIVASSIIFTFVVPILFSNLLVRWKVAKQKKKS